MAKPYTFKRDNSESSLLPSKKGFTLKGKNLVYKKSKHEVSKVVSLVKNGGKSTKSVHSP